MRPFDIFSFLLFVLNILAIFRAEAFFCDFETDLCGITQDNSDTGDWVRISYTTGRYGYTGLFLTPPLNDHTFGNSTGYYMFNAQSPHQSIFRLLTPTQTVQSNNNNTLVCLQFWYYMLGNTAELNVYLRINSSVSSMVWSRSGNRGNVWRAAQIQIQENSTYQVIFEGSTQWFGGEIIGIDDVMIINSPCQARDDNEVVNASCSFETWNLCGYQQDRSDDFDWRVHNGATATLGTGPSHDHTLGNELGFYMYIETSGYPRIEGHKARLISPVWTATEFEQCVEFWYHMYGSDTGALSLYIRPPMGSTLLASPAVRLVGHHGNIWLRATYAMNLTGSFELVFEAFRGSSILGDIAIDDVLIHDAPCANNTEEPIAEPIEFNRAGCNFEYEGLCNYTQDIYDDFDWIRKQGPTASRLTGPTTDHTFQNQFGHYMYIEASRRRAGMTARLMTPILTNKNTNMCVFFYYHMYGRRIDFLKVYKKDIGGGLPVDPLFVRHGNQGNIWKSQKVDIEGQTEYFQIVFEGSVGGSIYGDIAIDDIVLHNTSCDKVKLLAVINSTIDCDFDNRNNAYLCGFTQLANDDFDWQLRNGSTDSTATGPSADHTYGDTKGQYLYIEASSPRRPNERAKLISPLIEPADHLLCFKFWYHMKGEHVGRLNVRRRLEESLWSERLWTMNGDQSDRWIEAMLPINYYTNRDDFIETNMKIILEGVIGNGHLGDIAIDDIKLESHYCFQSDTAVVTLLACDFESGITKCGFSQDLSDAFDWKTFNVSDESQSRFANYSIAIGRQNNFAYLNMAGRNKGDLATLSTMTTTSNGTQRCLSFKYLMQGDVQQQLNIYSLDSEEALGLIGVVPNRRISEWKKCQFELPVDQDMSKILFEGVVGFEPKGFIALDDVTINIGGCITATTSPDNSVPPPPTVLTQEGNDGIGIAAELFISFTIILLFLILLSVGVMAIRRKYIKRTMQTGKRETQANIHFTTAQNISSDLAVENPLYEITGLDNT